MAKPILVLTLEGTPDFPALDYAKSHLAKLLGDEYYSLILVGKEAKVQVFYEKDFNHVKYEELKQIIEKEVLNAPNKNI